MMKPRPFLRTLSLAVACAAMSPMVMGATAVPTPETVVSSPFVNVPQPVMAWDDTNADPVLAATTSFPTISWEGAIQPGVTSTVTPHYDTKKFPHIRWEITNTADLPSGTSINASTGVITVGAKLGSRYGSPAKAFHGPGTLKPMIRATVTYGDGSTYVRQGGLTINIRAPYNEAARGLVVWDKTYTGFVRPGGVYVTHVRQSPEVRKVVASFSRVKSTPSWAVVASDGQVTVTIPQSVPSWSTTFGAVPVQITYRDGSTSQAEVAFDLKPRFDYSWQSPVVASDHEILVPLSGRFGTGSWAKLDANGPIFQMSDGGVPGISWSRANTGLLVDFSTLSASGSYDVTLARSTDSDRVLHQRVLVVEGDKNGVSLDPKTKAIIVTKKRASSAVVTTTPVVPAEPTNVVVTHTPTGHPPTTVTITPGGSLSVGGGAGAVIGTEPTVTTSTPVSTFVPAPVPVPTFVPTTAHSTTVSTPPTTSNPSTTGSSDTGMPDMGSSSSSGDPGTGFVVGVLATVGVLAGVAAAAAPIVQPWIDFWMRISQ